MPVELSIPVNSPVSDFEQGWLKNEQVLVYENTQHYDAAKALYALGAVTLTRRVGGSIEVEPVQGYWPHVDTWEKFIGRVTRPVHIGSMVNGKA